MEFSKAIFPQEKREQNIKKDKLLTYPQSLYTTDLIVDIDPWNGTHFDSDQFKSSFREFVHSSVRRGMRVLLSFEHYSNARVECENISANIPNVALVRHSVLKKKELDLYYDWMSERFGFNPNHASLIASDTDLNLGAAMEKSMGLVTGSTLAEAIHKAPFLITKSEVTPFDPMQLVYAHYQQDAVNIVGIVGHTGSGKTTLSNRMHNAVRHEVPTDILHLDSYHAFSRSSRRSMLRQAKLLPRGARWAVENHENWYLFDKAREDLTRLRQFKEIKRTGMYDQKSGNLVGEIDIEPDPKGHLILFEGVATHKFPGYLDTLVVLTTHPATRLKNLKNRDDYPTEEDRMERLRLTQRSEIDYIRKASQIAGDIIFMTPDYHFYEVPVAGIL